MVSKIDMRSTSVGERPQGDVCPFLHNINVKCTSRSRQTKGDYQYLCECNDKMPAPQTKIRGEQDE